ncbi:hypothetical protein EVAR_36101_1 [Eumeta japonica]|uniref:Uncharacterized protein n=1 Tax=Eumeta variegata TaxID=151549 RepID=A0A4C1X4Z7_EUMVA|nr:hypothetical protein EVAR_36101_1 [Eumeta japonica]
MEVKAKRDRQRKYHVKTYDFYLPYCKIGHATYTAHASSCTFTGRYQSDANVARPRPRTPRRPPLINEHNLFTAVPLISLGNRRRD